MPCASICWIFRTYNAPSFQTRTQYTPSFQTRTIDTPNFKPDWCVCVCVSMYLCISFVLALTWGGLNGAAPCPFLPFKVVANALCGLQSSIFFDRNPIRFYCRRRISALKPWLNPIRLTSAFALVLSFVTPALRPPLGITCSTYVDVHSCTPVGTSLETRIDACLHTHTHYSFTRCSKGEIRLCSLCLSLFLLKSVSENRLCL